MKPHVKFALKCLLVLILWVWLSSMNTYDHGPPSGWIYPTPTTTVIMVERTGQ